MLHYSKYNNNNRRYKKFFFHIILIIICIQKVNKIPKITVFLPIYNKGEYLKRSISSLQNQTFKDIEIIAINDGSTDNCLKTLKKFQKKDKRIKIFNNDRNRGPLYSRAMGILNSSSDYLMNLDADDKLMNNNSLKILYENVKHFKTDLFQFLIKRIPLFKNQTERFYNMNKNQLNEEDFIITNKLVIKKLYIKAFQTIKTRIFAHKWIIHDDNIWNTLVKNYAHSKAIVKEYIYYYKRNLNSLNFKMNSPLDLISLIYRFDAYQKYDNTNNIAWFQKQLHKIISLINKIDLGYIFKETRNKLKHTLVNFININHYYLNKTILSEINYIINKLSNKKYILLFNTKSILMFYTTYVNITKYLQKNKKRFLFVRHKQIMNLMNYIYKNDILIGFDGFIGLNDYKIMNKLHRDNKYYILVKNTNKNIINKYNKYKNITNIIIKSIDDNLYKYF